MPDAATKAIGVSIRGSVQNPNNTPNTIDQTTNANAQLAIGSEDLNLAILLGEAPSILSKNTIYIEFIRAISIATAYATLILIKLTPKHSVADSRNILESFVMLNL
jgi:hypothetical protein